MATPLWYLDQLLSYKSLKHIGNIFGLKTVLDPEIFKGDKPCLKLHWRTTQPLQHKIYDLGRWGGLKRSDYMGKTVTKSFLGVTFGDNNHFLKIRLLSLVTPGMRGLVFF